MTNLDAFRTFSALTILGTKDLPIRVSHRVALTISKLKDAVSITSDLQKQLIEKYGGKISEDGRIIFDKKTEETVLAAFQNEWDELNGLESGVSIDPIVLTYKDAEDIKLAPNVLMDLNGVLELSKD